MAETNATATDVHGTDSARGVDEVVERFRDAYDRRDVEGVLELVADDVVWVLAPGAFKGKEGVRQYLDWDRRLSPTVTSRSSSIGVLVKGNIAVMETLAEASAEGISYEYPVVTIFELGEDRKIRRIRSYYEKLGIMQQVANKYPGIKGWVLKKLINFIVAQGEKGLEQPESAKMA